MKSRREREWDKMIPTDTRKLVYRRRLGDPDGEEREVMITPRGRKYPWPKMQDGDFFVVEITGSENSMRTAFKQGAVRNDFEVAIHRVDGGLRVTRVIGGIAEIKRRARAEGYKAPHFDMRAYYRARRSGDR